MEFRYILVMGARTGPKIRTGPDKLVGPDIFGSVRGPDILGPVSSPDFLKRNENLASIWFDFCFDFDRFDLAFSTLLVE